MADEKLLLNLTLDVNADDAKKDIQDLKDKIEDIEDVDLSKSIKTLKQELKLAQKEADKMFQEFGAGSKEFVTAATRVADLKNQMDELNLAVSNFNPDNKLQGLVSLGKAGVGAIQGVTGAMAILGVESDSAAETIAKLQGLMAFSDSLNSLGDLKDSYNNINTLIRQSTILQKANNAVTALASTIFKAFGVSVATTSTAFKALRTAIMATGIGLLIVGISTLITKISDWVSSTDDAEASQKRLNAALERQQQLLQDELAGIDYVGKARVLRAKIAGQTEAEIRNIEDKAGQDRIKAFKSNYEALDALAADGSKRTLEQTEELNKKRTAAFSSYLDEVNKEELRGLQQQADVAEKGRQKAKSDSDKAIATAKSNADKAKALKDKEISELKTHVDAVIALNKKALFEIALIGKSEREKELYTLKVNYDEQNTIIAKARTEEEKFFKKYNSVKSLGQEKYNAGLLAIQTKYEDASKNQTILYLEGQFESEKKYQKLIDDYASEANNKVLNTYQQQRIAITAEINNLMVNATDEKKKVLKSLEAEQLAAVERMQQLSNSSITAETKLITTQVNNSIEKGDTPEAKKAKIEAVRLAELDAENAAFELKKAQMAGQDAELELLAAQHQANLVNINKEASAAKKQIDKEELEAKKQIVITTSGLLKQASSLAGEHTVAGKAMAVAATTIDTYTSAMAAFKGMVSSIPGPVGIGLGVASAALAVATGISNIKKILSVKVPNAKGDSGGSAASISAPTITTAPTVQATDTQTANNVVQDVRVTNQEGQVIKAYVVDKDIQEAEQRRAMINNRSTI